MEEVTPEAAETPEPTPTPEPTWTPLPPTPENMETPQVGVPFGPEAMGTPNP